MTALRMLLLGLVVAAVGALAWQAIAQDPGLVLVRHGGTDYSTTVPWALLGLLAGALLLWLAWTLLAMPFRAWHGRRDRIARERLGSAMEAMHQGHYARAETLFQQAADDGGPGIARVAAAQAALARDARDDARRHLAGLGEHDAATLAIAEAELALRDERPTDALVALDAPAAQPLPPRGLLLRARALAASGQSAQAYGLLGALRQHKALPDAQWSQAEARWAAAMLHEADDANALAERWESLPKPLRSEPPVVAAYADRAAALGWDEAALKSLGGALDTRWDEGLASRYARLPVGRDEERRTRMDAWLKAHPSSPALLLGLARAAWAQGDPARAERHAEAAIAQGAGSPAWELLGDVYAGTGHGPQAEACYRNALRAARGDAVEPLHGASPAPAPVAAAGPGPAVVAEPRERPDADAPPLPPHIG